MVRTTLPYHIARLVFRTLDDELIVNLHDQTGGEPFLLQPLENLDHGKLDDIGGSEEEVIVWFEPLSHITLPCASFFMNLNYFVSSQFFPL